MGHKPSQPETLAKHPFCCNHQHTHRNSNFSPFAPEVEEQEYCNETVFHFLALFTPFCVTYDFDSEEDGAVTVRDRDTMEQERVKIEDLKAYFEKKFEW